MMFRFMFALVSLIGVRGAIDFHGAIFCGELSCGSDFFAVLGLQN